MKIIFIGFMAAGKSFFSKRLAERLNMERIDMDGMVLRQSGRASVSEIFEKDGETKFRELEIATAKSFGKKDNVIIDSGGGVVLNKIILDYLRIDGVVVFLDSPLAVIEKRLKGDKARPLWQDKERFRRLYKLRLSLYREYSDVMVKTGSSLFFSADGKSHKMTPAAEKILELIIKKIKPALSVKAPNKGSHIKRKNKI